MVKIRINLILSGIYYQYYVHCYQVFHTLIRLDHKIDHKWVTEKSILTLIFDFAKFLNFQSKYPLLPLEALFY